MDCFSVPKSNSLRDGISHAGHTGVVRVRGSLGRCSRLLRRLTACLPLIRAADHGTGYCGVLGVFLAVFLLHVIVDPIITLMLIATHLRRCRTDDRTGCCAAQSTALSLAGWGRGGLGTTGLRFAGCYVGLDLLRTLPFERHDGFGACTAGGATDIWAI